MEKKLIALVFIALLAGLGGGYGLGFMAYQPQILELQSDISSFEDTLLQAQSNVSNVQSEISTLRTDYSELQTRYNELVMNYSNLQSEISILKTSENKTWHFVMNFTANETKTSPKFYIQGQQWRIRWKLLGIEKPYYMDGEMTLVYIEWVRAEVMGRNEWTGFIVCDDSRFVVSVLDIPLNQISFANLYTRGSIGEVKFVACDGDPDVKGIHYIFQGEGEFYIEIKDILTPVALTVESYH